MNVHARKTTGVVTAYRRDYTDEIDGNSNKTVILKANVVFLSIYLFHSNKYRVYTKEYRGFKVV
jgi:hypothetical protein